MTLVAAVGQSNAFDAREAGRLAMRQAMEKAGRVPVVFGWIIASHVFALSEVIAGAVDLLGDAPLLGFSTTSEISSQGRSSRSVLVGLLCATDVRARAGWWPDFVQNTRPVVESMLAALKPAPDQWETLLVVADGLNGENQPLNQLLSIDGLPVIGCLSGGELWRGRTFQIGGRQGGSGGLAAAVLGGNLAIGVGAAHGWQPVGAPARLTRVQGPWVRTLDDAPAGELYARWLGHPAREWSHAPLSDLVRLYPLGLADNENGEHGILSPLRIEVDGSLRMNKPAPEGRIVDLMVGSVDGCREAARQAAQQALTALGSAKPRLAVLLVDVAWQTLLDLAPTLEVDCVRDVIGPDVPVLGGYTYGQIMRPDIDAPVRLLNQHILVLLFG